MDIKISVVMCTRNRGARLKTTLESFVGQEFEGEWELIVVDNGSTDETPDIVESFARDCPYRLRLVKEPLPGVSRARNRGIAAAAGEVVAFTDDDCYPESDYIAEIDKQAADQGDDFGGGRLLLFDKNDRRVTVQEKKESLTLEPYSFIPPAVIHGANMWFRRKVLLEHGGFDERLGTGTRFQSGEDTDMLRRLSWAGCRGSYNPRIVVYHHHGRKTEEAERKLLRGYCRGRGACMVKFVMNPATRAVYWPRWRRQLRTRPFEHVWRELLFAFVFFVTQGARHRTLWEHPREGLSTDR